METVYEELMYLSIIVGIIIILVILVISDLVTNLLELREIK